MILVTLTAAAKHEVLH